MIINIKNKVSLSNKNRFKMNCRRMNNRGHVAHMNKSYCINI